jgi:hypothetical protein
MRLAGRRSLLAAFGSALVLAATPAAAATYVFNLSGSIADGTSFPPFTSGGFTYSIFELDLGGITPVDLVAGDMLDVTVTLDGLLTVPAASAFTFVGIGARTEPSNLGTPPGGTTSSSVFTPIGGEFNGAPSPGACSNCISASLFLPGPATSFQIGGGNGLITILDLVAEDPSYTGPISVTGFSFRFQATDIVAAVPEPATWAMMIGGFGMIGGAMRRSQRQKAEVAHG